MVVASFGVMGKGCFGERCPAQLVDGSDARLGRRHDDGFSID